MTLQFKKMFTPRLSVYCVPPWYTNNWEWTGTSSKGNSSRAMNHSDMENRKLVKSSLLGSFHLLHALLNVCFCSRQFLYNGVMWPRYDHTYFVFLAFPPSFLFYYSSFISFLSFFSFCKYPSNRRNGECWITQCNNFLIDWI